MKHFLFRKRNLILLLPLFLLWGCAAEYPSVLLPIEKAGGTPPKVESMGISLDASGLLNGRFVPDIPSVRPQVNYPVNYIGSWTYVQTMQNSWPIMRSEQQGALVNIVATASRVIFDFYNPDQYPNPGKLSFKLDGAQVGAFDLNQPAVGGTRKVNFEVDTGKTTVSTVTMTLTSGHVVVTGYVLIYP